MKYTYYLKRFWPLYLFTGIIVIAAVFGTSEAVTTIAQNTPIPRNHLLIIDPGHGGEDGGAISCTGVLESQLNLQISLRLNDLLHLLGYETKMVRSSDISIYTEGISISQKKASDLRNRVKIVNETENAILISIHQNTFPEEKYSGAQVFYNHVGMAQDLAKQIQSAFIETVNPDSHRQSKAATGIFMMEHIRNPGILIECGFLSNREEEAMLCSEDYQKQLCCVIASALSCYLSA